MEVSAYGTKNSSSQYVHNSFLWHAAPGAGLGNPAGNQRTGGPSAKKSPGIFHESHYAYLHYGKIRFDSGLKMELLQEYFLIALDVFRKFPYSEDKNELTAWLSLLVTEELEDAERLIRDYPWLQEIYEEIAMLRRRPEEVLGMFSEALRILDQNTVKYMIEELQKQLDEKDVEKAAVIREKDAEKAAVIREKDAEIAELKRQLEALRPG